MIITIKTVQPVVNLILLILATQAFAISVQSSDDGSYTACNSLECAVPAAQIASYMNNTENPCMDFYNYACGNIKNAVRPTPSNAAATDLLYDENYVLRIHHSAEVTNEKLSNSVYKMLALNIMPTSHDADVTRLNEFTRNFYESCRMWKKSREINTAHANQLSVKNLNGIYRHMVSIQKRIFNKDYDIESMLAALVKTGDNNGYLTVSPFTEFMDNAFEHKDNNQMKTVRAVVQLIIPYNNSLFTWRRHKILTEYLDLVVDSEFSFSDIKKTFHRLFYAQSNWTMYHLGIRCLKEYENQYDFALSQLDSISACLQPKNPFSWSNFFGALLETKLDAETVFKVPDLVKVIGYANYMKTQHMLRNRPVSAEVVLLIFDWLLGFSQFFPKYLRDAPLVQGRTSVDIYGIGETFKSCQDLTVKILSPIVRRMSLKVYHREDFNDIRHLIKKIESAIINNVRRQSWISSRSKDAIGHKIKQLMSETIVDLNPKELKTFYEDEFFDYRLVSKAMKRDNLASWFGSLLAIASLSNRRSTWELMSGISSISLY